MFHVGHAGCVVHCVPLVLFSATSSEQCPKCLSRRTSMDRDCLGEDLNVDFLHCYLSEVIILVCVVISVYSGQT